MKKNKKSELVAVAVSTFSTFWASYKRAARRRNESMLDTVFNDFFGVEMNDADAAKELAKDVAKIRDSLKAKRTEKKFNDIVKNSY